MSKNISHIIKTHSPKLKSFINYRVSNKEDAEDIFQDVLLQFIKITNDVSNPIERVSSWLFKVAQNKIINKKKKKKEIEAPRMNNLNGDDFVDDVIEILLGEDKYFNPEEMYFRSIILEELDRALRELPIEQSEVFELSEIQGYSMKEISDKMNSPINTCISRKHYAIKHIRNRMKTLYDEISLN